MAITTVVKSSNRGATPGERRGGRSRGTPNKATADVRDLARTHGPAAIKRAARLAGLVDGGDGMAESEQAQIAALGIILDRAYGRPSQAHIVQGDADNPIETRIELVIVDPSPRSASLPAAANARPI